MLSDADLQAIALTLQVAATTTVILLVLGVPLAWWLARTRSRWRLPLQALVALPIVLPPTVIGFYLLVLMGPQGPVGRWTQALGLGVLTFSFAGLVVASVVYSLPFMVQPVLAAMQSLGERPLEAAATLRASPLDRFVSVVLPLARPGLITGTVMAFAHTLGEFGVVLMVGGNIPGVTRVVSVQLYDHVEALEYADAHRLAALMLVGAFVMLLALQWINRARAR